MSAPTIYRNAEDVGIDTRGLNNFGRLGEIFAVTIHHSAGPRATSKAKAQELHRAYHAQHKAQDWGGIGYHWSMDDRGRFYRLRPIEFKGAHTGGHNTGNVGVMVHGNYDRDRLTWKQRQSIKWLFRGGFLVLTGQPEAEIALVRGHQEWPGPTNATACPGKNLMASLTYRRNRDFH
jgi:hypothetical protein